MQASNLASIIGKNIVSQRKKLNLTQKSLAEKLDITVDSMMRIEKGLMSPKMSRLQEIADTLQCSVMSLFQNDEERSYDNDELLIIESIKGLSASEKKYVLEMIELMKKHLKD